MNLLSIKEYKGCLSQKSFDIQQSKGRREPYDKYGYTEVVDPFVFDIDQILNSKASRRLDEKTQVFPSPENPHVRTRSRHTREVAAFAVTAADILGLNSRLAEAIALGHDIGHAPYGHLGEEVISELSGKKFRHEVFAVVVAQFIERQKSGLNLMYETYEGILNHSRGGKNLIIDKNLPLEYALVMFADKITYTFSDIEDIQRYGLKRLDQFPKVLFELGNNQRERMTSCLIGLVKESANIGFISFFNTPEAKLFEELRHWLYDNVYFKLDLSHNRIVLKKIYEFLGNTKEFKGCDPAILLALLTDREANELSSLFLRRPIITEIDLHNFGITEIAPFIKNRKIDFTDPGLDWGTTREQVS